jgi:hypothetical protein
LRSAGKDFNHFETVLFERLLHCDAALGEHSHGAYGYRKELDTTSPQFQIAFSEVKRLRMIEASSSFRQTQRRVDRNDIRPVPPDTFEDLIIPIDNSGSTFPILD